MGGVTDLMALTAAVVLLCGCVGPSDLGGGQVPSATVLKKGAGLKGSGTTTSIARPQDTSSAECRKGCDETCRPGFTVCGKPCGALLDDECDREFRELSGCQRPCIQTSGSNGPEERAVCLDGCLAAFEEGCDNDEFVSCQEGCTPKYLSCLRSCYFDC